MSKYNLPARLVLKNDLQIIKFKNHSYFKCQLCGNAFCNNRENDPTVPETVCG